MLSILEVPTVRQRVARISVETYHAMSEQGLVTEQTELLRGAIVEKMTKSPLHVAIVTRMFELISGMAGAGKTVRKEDPLTLTDSEPEPDIAVVEGRPDDFRANHPGSALLVVEVAVRTEETDREKASIYAEAGVAEYWLVLPEKRIVEVFTQPTDGKYASTRSIQAGGIVISQSLPSLRVDVGSLFG